MSGDSVQSSPTEANVVIRYRPSGLVLLLVVIAGGFFFVFAPVAVASDASARIVCGLLAVFLFVLGGYSTVWAVRGLLADPGPLVIGHDGLHACDLKPFL